MIIKTIFSGFGGQGVIMMGYLLAMAGIREDKNVTCLPSYGAEVREGRPTVPWSSPLRRSRPPWPRSRSMPSS